MTIESVFAQGTAEDVPKPVWVTSVISVSSAMTVELENPVLDPVAMSDDSVD